MTEILNLPVELSAEGVRRLADHLEVDARAGVDLGPRRPQIACLSASISRSLRDLREALRRAAEELPDGDPRLGGLRDAAAGVTRLAQAVMAGAAGLHAQPASGA